MKKLTSPHLVTPVPGFLLTPIPKPETPGDHSSKQGEAATKMSNQGQEDENYLGQSQDSTHIK